MGTRMQQEGDRILNALDESKVATLITLYEKGILHSNGVVRENVNPRRDYIRTLLIEHLDMSAENADYWLDWFKL